MFETILLAVYVFTDAPLDVTPEMAAPVRAAFVAMEVLDSDTAIYWFRDGYELRRDADLRCMRERLRQCRSYPRVGWVNVLPPIEGLYDAVQWNRDYRDRLAELIELRDAVNAPDADNLDAAKAEAERLAAVYYDAVAASNTHACITYRREALKRLLDALGPVAFYQGQLPAPVPLRETPWLTYRFNR